MFFALQTTGAPGGLDRVRWGVCFLLAAGLHLAVAAAVLYRRAPSAPVDAAAAILVEIGPALTAPPNPQSDIPPGPEQMETPPADAAEEPVTEPAPPLEEALVTPVVENAEVVLPPMPEPEPVEAEQLQQPIASVDRTTAPPALSAPPGETAMAPMEGASSPMTSDGAIRWQSVLLGHLERHKRYPSRAKRRRQEGVVSVRLTLARDGYVLARRIAVSSGVSALDAEALALIDRAQPLPPPPPEIRGEIIELVAPIEFFIR